MYPHWKKKDGVVPDDSYMIASIQITGLDMKEWAVDSISQEHSLKKTKIKHYSSRYRLPSITFSEAIIVDSVEVEGKE